MQMGYLEGYGMPSCWIEFATVKVPSLAVHIDDDVYNLIVSAKRAFQRPAGYIMPEDSTLNDSRQVALENEAKLAVKRRIFIKSIVVSAIVALVDVHLSQHSGLPMAVDTHRQAFRFCEAVRQSTILIILGFVLQVSSLGSEDRVSPCFCAPCGDD